MSRLTIKDNIWYTHDFLKAVGNNIRVLFLIYDWLYWPFNAAVIAYFWYFNKNTFSVITPLTFHNDNVSLIQMFRLHTWVLFNIFLFFCAEVKSEFLYQNFYWKSTICEKQSNSYVRNGLFNEELTSKNRRVSFPFELSYNWFQQPHDDKKHWSRIALPE